VTEDERRVVVLIVASRRLYGSASPEMIVRWLGRGRVEGYAALASLEREGLVDPRPLRGAARELQRADVRRPLTPG
jgi:hypothetical protein